MNKERNKQSIYSAIFLIDTKPQYHYIGRLDMLIGNLHWLLKWAK